ncbi:MAG: methyltransferase domain-containing protein, partial [Candidatus Micrarchaeota archaeon]
DWRRLIVRRRLSWLPKPQEGLRGLTPFERVRNAWREARKVEDYALCSGRLSPRVMAELRSRAVQSSRGSTRFLDVGAGFGVGVDAAARLGNVFAVGLAPHKPRIAAGASLNWILGTAERVVVPDFFDVIQSHFCLSHAANYAVSFENLLNSLRKGGALFLNATDTPRCGSFVLADLTDPHSFWGALKTQGFTVEGVGNNVKVTRPHYRKADLSKFYSDADINYQPGVAKK